MCHKHVHALIGVVNIYTCHMYVQKEGKLSTQDKTDSPLSKSMLTNMKSGVAMVVQPLVVWSTDSLYIHVQASHLQLEEKFCSSTVRIIRHKKHCLLPRMHKNDLRRPEIQNFPRQTCPRSPLGHTLFPHKVC